MRKIEYIFIDSDCQRCDSASKNPNSFELFRAQAGSSNAQANDSKSRHHALPNFGYHFVVNSQGLVIHPTNIDIPAKLIPGPIYDRDKYNKCSICIRYCGSLLPHAWLIDPNTSCKSVMQQRAALLKLLVQLRGIYPSAKILGASELDGKEIYAKNIIVSDSMNVLRRELSDLP